MTEKVTLVRRDGLPMPLMAFAAPEDLAAWHAAGLRDALGRGERRLTVSCFDAESIFGFDPAKTARLVLRAVMDVLYDHPEAESLEVLCSGEAAWRAYSFCWNFWYAETKLGGGTDAAGPVGPQVQ